MTSKTVWYFHGFASSSLSDKARLTTDYFRQHHPDIRFQALDIPYTPAEAINSIEQALAEQAPQAVIGSSLGGFLATFVAERYACRACLVNPAVAPHSILPDYLGRYYHPVLQRYYDVSAEHMALLQQLEPKTLQQPQNYLVLLQSGDEVLDYRLALDFYQGAEIELVTGGDHSFVGYADYLPHIAKFCQLE